MTMKSHTITHDWMVIVPAPGTPDRTTARGAKASFLAGHDYVGDYSVGFARLSVRDFAPGVLVVVRYKDRRNAVVVTVPKQ